MTKNVSSHRKAVDDALETLYALLSKLGLRPPDLVRELKREGKRIRFLSELSLEELREQIAEAERVLNT